MADVRYIALDRLTYARALVEVTRFARTYDGPEFRYGPLELRTLEVTGLEVTGQELSGVLDILDRVHGLVRFPDLEWPVPV